MTGKRQEWQYNSPFRNKLTRITKSPIIKCSIFLIPLYGKKASARPGFFSVSLSHNHHFKWLFGITPHPLHFHLFHSPQHGWGFKYLNQQFYLPIMITLCLLEDLQGTRQSPTLYLGRQYMFAYSIHKYGCEELKEICSLSLIKM